MFGVFQYMKTWLVTYSIGVGLSSLNIYSNSYIYIKKTTSAWYRRNKTIKYYTNMVMNFIYGVFNRYSTYKIEPFYDLWLSISYKSNNKYNEEFMNLDTGKITCYPLLKNIFVNVLYQPSYAEEDFRNLFTVDDIKNLFKIIYSQIDKINYIFYDINSDFLILIKSIDKYVCRVGTYQRFNLYSGIGCPRAPYQERDMPHSGLTPRIEVNEEYNDNITLNKIKKPFLCVEYSHPKMDKKIYLDIDIGFFVENNELLSPMFVHRCLDYQKEFYIFDLDYKIHILDNMMKTFCIDRTSYILLTKNGYEIKTML